MAGPGGTEVGRVSVKVVPDTSKFAAELKAKLARLDEEFEVDVGINTNKAMAEFQALKRRIESDDIEATLKLNTRGDGFGGRGGSTFQRIAQKLGAPMRAFGNFFTFVGKGLTELADNMTGFVSTVLRGMGRFSGSIGQSISSMAGLAGTMVAVLAIGGLLAGAFAAIAGAVMLLVGLLTAALTSIPVLLAGIAAPIAAVVIGFDGIKEAAKTLTPQLESLKKTLTGTFKDGFTPIFERLKGLFPTLREGLNSVAQGVIDLADRLSRLVTTEQGIRKIKTAFQGVNDFIRSMTPGIEALTRSLLNVAATRELFVILGTTLGLVMEKLGGFFDRIRESGQLRDGLMALQTVLLSIVDLFTQLMVSALDFFTGAAPGITNFFQGLERFFAKIDWKALGANFGAIFTKLGEFFANLNQATIDNFVQSFINMGNAVQRFIDSGGMELLIFGLYMLNNAFVGVMNIINFVVGTFWMLMGAVDSAAKGVGNAWRSIKRSASDAKASIDNTISRLSMRIFGVFTDIKRTVRDAGQQIRDSIRNAFTRAAENARNRVEAIVDAVRQIPAKARSILRNIGDTLVSAGKSLIDGFIKGVRSKIGEVRDAISSAVSAARAYFPFSPAKVGPFSGRGYTTHSGRALIEDWAQGIESATPSALRSVRALMDSANNTASVDWNGHVTSDGFGGVRNAVFDGVMDAFHGSRLQVDGNGMAQLVNKVNNRNARR